MKKSRLTVPPDSGEPPKGFHISEAFGSRAEYDEFEHHSLVEDDVKVASARRSFDAQVPRSGGLRMMMVLMEHPFFALAPRATPIDYRSRDGSVLVQVEPGPQGMATIHDADVVMFLIETLAASGLGSDREVTFRPGDYLRAVGAATSGSQYESLANAIARLLTTKVTTNVQSDGKPGPAVSFTWLEAAGRLGRNWHVTLPAWIVEGSRSSALLKIPTSYFELRGMNRGVYLVARKHLGHQARWDVRTSTLWAKLGSSDTLAHFRHMLRKLAAADQMPDFHLKFEEGPDGLLIVTPRVVNHQPVGIVI